MTTVTIYNNLVDGITYRSLDGATVQRKCMISGEWLASKRDIRDVRNQSASYEIVIGGDEDKGKVSTMTPFRRLLARVFGGRHV